MSDEVSKTIAGKYNPALEAEATAWLGEVDCKK